MCKLTKHQILLKYYICWLGQIPGHVTKVQPRPCHVRPKVHPLIEDLSSKHSRAVGRDGIRLAERPLLAPEAIRLLPAAAEAAAAGAPLPTVAAGGASSASRTGRRGMPRAVRSALPLQHRFARPFGARQIRCRPTTKRPSVGILAIAGRSDKCVSISGVDLRRIHFGLPLLNYGRLAAAQRPTE